MGDLNVNGNPHISHYCTNTCTLHICVRDRSKYPAKARTHVLCDSYANETGLRSTVDSPTPMAARAGISEMRTPRPAVARPKNVLHKFYFGFGSNYICGYIRQRK